MLDYGDFLETDLSELIGNTVMGVEVDGEEQHYLRITLDDGTVLNYGTFADCCSETWFADILGVDALLGNEVLDVEEREIESTDYMSPRTRQEYDVIYGYKITTEAGVTDLIFRNSSNGYYGGEMVLCKKAPKDIDFHPVFEDYSA